MSAHFDMLWEELQAYQGSSPRPDRFDQFWDDALTQLDQVDPQSNRSLASFQFPNAHGYDFSFTGVEGARIYAKLLFPKFSNQPSPAVISFHGYGGQSADWSHYMHYLSMGYVVAALDCRGQSGQSQEGRHYEREIEAGRLSRGISGSLDHLLFRNVFLDTVLLTKLVSEMTEVDATRIATTGGSQGGGLAIACAALSPLVKLCAPLYPFLTDYRRLWELNLLGDRDHELELFLKSERGKEMSEEEILDKLSYLDIQFLAPLVSARTLFAIGMQDRICPPSTQMATYNKITAPKSLQIYEKHGHETLPGHSDNILQFFQKYL